MTDKQASENPGARQEQDPVSQQKKKYEIKLEGENDQAESVIPPAAEAPGMSLMDALQRMEEAEDAVRRHQDDMLRVQAEMQNIRRRTEQEVEKAHKYGQEKLVSELLAVADNLERALDAASLEVDQNTGADPIALEKLKAIRDGVELTLKSLVDCFRKFSIEPIDPLGEPFDPQKHQAMAMVDNPKAEPNTVTAVMQKGYCLHGRVIRPAMVLVSK